MDQNRDGFIDKADLRDTFAALGEPPLRSLPLPSSFDAPISPSPSSSLDLQFC